MQLQFRKISTQGQVSIGKKFAGQNVKIQRYADGSVVLTPIEVVPTFEFNLMKNQMFQNRLVEFDKWEAENKPCQTDFDKSLL